MGNILNLKTFNKYLNLIKEGLAFCNILTAAVDVLWINLKLLLYNSPMLKSIGFFFELCYNHYEIFSIGEMHKWILNLIMLIL